VIAFESTADLTGNLQDTGVSQIFLYDADKGDLIRVTDDTGGCSGASVSPVPRDISVGYACHGVGFFYHYLAGKHFQLPTDGGSTAQAVAELGSWFMVVSTTANMLGGDPTQGHQLYLLNLFKLAATPLD
jgi:Tol biopolymer transport system component